MVVLRRPEPEAHSTLGPFTSTLARAEPETAMTGQSVTLHGLGLGGTNVQVEPDHRDPTIELPPLISRRPGPPIPLSPLRFPEWPIGAYELRVTMEPPGGGRWPSFKPFALLRRAINHGNSVTRAPNPPQACHYRAHGDAANPPGPAGGAHRRLTEFCESRHYRGDGRTDVRTISTFRSVQRPRDW